MTPEDKVLAGGRGKTEMRVGLDPPFQSAQWTLGPPVGAGGTQGPLHVLPVPMDCPQKGRQQVPLRKVAANGLLQSTRDQDRRSPAGQGLPCSPALRARVQEPPGSCAKSQESDCGQR